jgi:hypothetical protein
MVAAKDFPSKRLPPNGPPHTGRVVTGLFGMGAGIDAAEPDQAAQPAR